LPPVSILPPWPANNAPPTFSADEIRRVANAARRGHTPSARALVWLIYTTPEPLPAPLAAWLSGCRARFIKRESTARRPQKNRHKATQAAFYLTRPAGRQHQSNRPKLARPLAVELELFQRNGKRVSKTKPPPTAAEKVSATAFVCTRQIERDRQAFGPIAREVFADLCEIHRLMLEQARQLDAIADELAALAGTSRTGQRLADTLPDFVDFLTAKIAALTRQEGNN
jgi:hypothetical protein